MKDITKKYSNDDITIVWKPSTCIHAALCWRGDQGLKEVFNPALKPWINPEGASTDAIIQRIKACPSGALSYYENNTEQSNPISQNVTLVEAMPNGPLIIRGPVKIKDTAGNETTKNEATALCRCGSSQNKPYCDGAHKKVEFKG